MAFLLLTAGLPIVPLIAASADHPSFTLDICHPAEAVGVASIQCSLPLPPFGSGDTVAEFAAKWQETVTPAITLAPAPPPSPPPESLSL